MDSKNKLSKMITKFDRMPPWLRRKALTFTIGRVVPYVTTSGLVADETGTEPIVCKMIWAWVPRK